jgi:hypothetical protein
MIHNTRSQPIVRDFVAVVACFFLLHPTRTAAAEPGGYDLASGGAAAYVSLSSEL